MRTVYMYMLSLLLSEVLGINWRVLQSISWRWVGGTTVVLFHLLERERTLVQSQ